MTHDHDAPEEAPNEFRMTRRSALAALAAGTIVSVSGLLRPAMAFDPQQALGTEAYLKETFGGRCLVATEAVEGPYYIDERIMRSDIRDNQPGLPLELDLQILNANAFCSPVAGAVVSIWHCNARGEYSGYLYQSPDAPPDFSLIDRATGNFPPKDAERFLRGVQTTDAEGRVKFTTIFPGWYRPRVAHIHVRVYLSAATSLTTQLYFPDSLASAVYSSGDAYVQRGPSPFNIVNDPIRAQSGLVGGSDIMAVTMSEDGVMHAQQVIGASHI
jgi:protocatechuate 3,4-dioxygenase beta subunit